MSPTETTCDWARDRRVSWLWPAAFGVVGVGWLVVPDPWGALLAGAGFAVAGALCVGNTLRCQRTHCAITGPLYLVAVLLFLARAGGLSAPGNLIVAIAVVGTIIAFVPEWRGTRYLGTDGASTLATTGTLLAAGLVAACCLGPTLFVLFGVAVAGLGTLGALEPYRPLFLLGGLACWALAYRQQRRARCASDACGTPARRRTSRVLLWSSLVVLGIAAGYPYAIAYFVG
jgi:mercuric ion transport protein